MTTQITDHVAQAQARLIEQFKNKPNLESLLSVLATQTQESEDVYFEVLLERTLDVAVGVQLDALGVIVGQDRDGDLDVDYRRRIRARIFTNRSSGLPNEILNIVRLVLNDATQNVKLISLPPASYEIELGPAAATQAVAADLIAFMRDATAGGVRAFLHYLTAAAASSFELAVTTFADGAILASATTIDIADGDLTDFPTSGTAIIDEGLAVEDVIMFTGRTATALLGVSGVANGHDDRAPISLNGASATGLGFGSNGTLTPNTLAEWQTDELEPTLPDLDNMYTFQELSGALIDQIGSTDWTVEDTPVFQRPTEAGEVGIEYAPDDGHICDDTTLLNIGAADDWTLILRMRLAAGDEPDVIVEKGVAPERWQIRTQGDGDVEFEIDPSAGGTLTLDIPVNHHVDKMFSLILVVDRTNDEVRLMSSLSPDIVVLDITGVAVTEPAAAATLGFANAGSMETGLVRHMGIAATAAFTRDQMIAAMGQGTSFGGDLSIITDGITNILGRYPSGSLEWIARYTGTVPSGIWPMQDAPGGTIIETIAGRDFTAFGGNSATGIAGENGRLAVEITDNVSGFILDAAHNAFMDADKDISIWCRIKVDDIDNSIRSLLGKHGNPDPRWYCASNGNTGTMNFQLDDAVNVRSTGPAGDLSKWGQWMDLIAVYDWTNGIFTARNSLMGDAAPIALAPVVQGDMSPNNQELHLGRGNQPPASSSHAGAQYGYLAVWDGHALTTAEQDEILGV